MATSRFKYQLSVDTIKYSNIINISFQHPDQQVPARALNQLIEFFRERHLQIFSSSQTSFLEGQLNIHRQKLRESENNLAAFKQNNRVFSLHEQRSLLLQQRLSLDTDLKTTQDRVQEVRQRISSLTSQMQKVAENITIGETTTQNNNIDTAQSTLLRLQLEEEELRTKYDESDPMLAMVREKMRLVKDFLVEQEKSSSESATVGRNNVYQNMEVDRFRARTELSALEARGAALKQQLNQLDGEIQDLDVKESELLSLQRELESNERNYKIYLTKLEEARISDEMDRSNMVSIKVIQKATVPLGPIPSNKRLKITVGMVLGAALGVALALFSEYIIGEGISSSEGVKKRLGLPVLATVPYKDQNKSRA